MGSVTGIVRAFARTLAVAVVAERSMTVRSAVVQKAEFMARDHRREERGFSAFAGNNSSRADR